MTPLTTTALAKTPGIGLVHLGRSVPTFCAVIAVWYGLLPVRWLSRRNSGQSLPLESMRALSAGSVVADDSPAPVTAGVAALPPQPASSAQQHSATIDERVIAGSPQEQPRRTRSPCPVRRLEPVALDPGGGPCYCCRYLFPRFPIAKGGPRMESTVGIALLGRGTVGGGVAALLHERRAHVERRGGTRYELLGIADRSRDPIALVDDPRTDLVIECIGGTEIALECIERALEARKHVVTANKDAVATQGPRLRALAAAKGVTLRYEASVASAVPIVTTLDHALAGDEVLEIGGVLNGTCNFILSKMREGRTFAESLLAAQVAGYAEADPRNDVEGVDAAHKLAILIQHAFGQPVTSAHIPRNGIRGTTSAAVRRARQHGYELKLVAHAERTARGIRAQVGPVLVPFNHPFARCKGVENVVRVVGASSGTLLFSGPGAGRDAAAAAVVGDVIAALRAIAERHAERRSVPAFAAEPVEPFFQELPLFAGYPVFGADLVRVQTRRAVGC